nr:uncharacterized protein LOC128696658 [Cherax quadricarinatus]
MNNMPTFVFLASPPSADILKFTKDLVATSASTSPVTPPPLPTRDVTPTTPNETPILPSLPKETHQSETFLPPATSSSSIEADVESSPPSSSPPAKRAKPTPTTPSYDSRLDTIPADDADSYFKWRGITFYTTAQQGHEMRLCELHKHLTNMTVKYTTDPSFGCNGFIPLPTLLDAIQDDSRNPRKKHLKTRLMILPIQRFKRLENGSAVSKL